MNCELEICRGGGGRWGWRWEHLCESSGEPHLWESKEAGWRGRLGYCTYIRASAESMGKGQYDLEMRQGRWAYTVHSLWARVPGERA